MAADGIIFVFVAPLIYLKSPGPIFFTQPRIGQNGAFSKCANFAACTWTRKSAKPGIIGLWQVSGRSKITDFEEVAALDQYYIEHWSLRLDIKILVKTVMAVLKRDGAF